MSRLSIMQAVTALFLIWITGCGPGDSTIHQPPELTEEGFPVSMVGAWETEFDGGVKWGLEFERDGSIERLIHSVVGPVVLADGAIYEEGPIEGTYCTFIMGPCGATYEPETNTVKAEIAVEYFRMQFEADALEGSIKDYFDGPVSSDGKTWETEWRSYGWLEGAAPPDANIIEANPRKLIFKKIDTGTSGENQ